MTMPARIPRTWRRLREEQRKTGRKRSETQRPAVTAVEPFESAKAAGLRYVSDSSTAGIRRIGKSRRFQYRLPDHRRVSDEAELRRIRSLAVPPAWKDVWICPIANGHLQATGRDARGRKQYRYHRRWREVRDDVKYGRLLAFARALPALRARIDVDLKKDGLPREKVLAAVVQLLAKTFIRVGNEEYARENGAIGLTTMRDAHAKIEGATMRFEFRGKSGVWHSVSLHDRRLARIVRACRELPGYELFQWVGADGVRQTIDSADVNQYLGLVTGADFTAKDFRTWAGTLLAWRTLSGLPACSTKAQARRNVLRAVEQVATRLGNTKAVCRKCYIHPAVFEIYQETPATASAFSTTSPSRRLHRSGLEVEEAALVQLLARHARGSLRRSA